MFPTKISLMLLRRASTAYRIMVIVAGLSLSATYGQSTDVLPDVRVGDTTARLRVVARGLPVEQEFVTPVFTQRVGPTDLVQVPDGSGDLLVTTYGGTAYRVGSNGFDDTRPFLDLANPSSPTYNVQFEFGGAHGLTSVVYHPQYLDATSPGFGRFYTIEPESSGSGVADFARSVINGDHHQEVVYEYRLENPQALMCDVACAQTKRELFRVTQPGWHHNLGDLEFDSTGLMYIGSGDGNVAGTQAPIMSDNALLLDNVFGKVLRIDPLGDSSENGQYGIPLDNPFADGPGGPLDEIYAYGLRNPYRLDYDELLDQLFSSETGELNVESIERIAMGRDHGWNLKEGSFLYDRTTKEVSIDLDSDGDGIGDTAAARNLQEPIFEYDRDDGRAVIGGAVMRDAAFPQLNGMYVFADFTGRLFYGDPTTGQMFELALQQPSAAAPYNIHSVNKDSDGRVYVLGIEDLGGGQFGGVVLQVMQPLTGNGDFDGNGRIDVSDLNQISAAVRSGEQDVRFDLDGNQIVDDTDRQIWIDEIGQTMIGDANLDGRYDSSDLVLVLQQGEFEDEIPGNSQWQTGDWDNDGDFTTSDLIASLVHNRYEKDIQNSIRLVPEPNSLGSILVTILVVRSRRRPLIGLVTPTSTQDSFNRAPPEIAGQSVD